jgi:hypothetical protein
MPLSLRVITASPVITGPINPSRDESHVTLIARAAKEVAVLPAVATTSNGSNNADLERLSDSQTTVL